MNQKCGKMYPRYGKMYHRNGKMCPRFCYFHLFLPDPNGALRRITTGYILELQVKWGILVISEYFQPQYNFAKKSAVTRIRTWVTADTTQGPNH